MFFPHFGTFHFCDILYLLTINIKPENKIVGFDEGKYSSWSLYEDEERGFQIKYPADWSYDFIYDKRGTGHISEVRFLSPKFGSGYANIFFVSWDSSSPNSKDSQDINLANGISGKELAGKSCAGLASQSVSVDNGGLSYRLGF